MGISADNYSRDLVKTYGSDSVIIDKMYEAYCGFNHKDLSTKEFCKFIAEYNWVYPSLAKPF